MVLGVDECHENDIKGKCPNGKCPSYEIYDNLEGKWPSWWYRKMPFIWFLLCIKAKLFELNVNWHVTPKTYLPNVNNATAFLFMKEEEKLIALLHSTTTAMRLSVVFLLIPYLTWHTHTPKHMMMPQQQPKKSWEGWAGRSVGCCYAGSLLFSQVGRTDKCWHARGLLMLLFLNKQQCCFL